jgi:endonuclease YncB( thermonuclease family)
MLFRIKIDNKIKNIRSLNNNMGICQSSNLNLKNATNDIPFFDFKDKKFTVKVVDVYDGDTCTVVFDYNKELVKYKVRCMGYDSPEMKPPKDLVNRSQHIAKAIQARNFFISKVTDLNLTINDSHSKKELKEMFIQNKKLVKMECHGLDKYGRILGTFRVNNKNINNEMISRRHGYPYDGGTKQNQI